MKIKTFGVLGFAVAVFAAASVAIVNTNKVEAFSGTGAGTPSSPYLIDTCEELQSIGATESTVDKLYWLADDVDCSASSGWNAGAGFDPIDLFEGTLDGRGHTITDLVINRPLEESVGLFEYIDDGMVTSINFGSGTQITGDQFVGVVAGRAGYSNLRDIQASGIVDANNYAGGLVGHISGWQDDMEIELSSFTGSVEADNWAGGLVGHTQYGFGIYHSYSDAVITADGAGGIVGHVQDSCGSRYINTVAVLGDVLGTSYGGGFVGRFQDISCDPAEINDSVSYAAVTGATGEGGAIGQLINATVTVSNTYFDATEAGTADCYGIADGGSTTPSCSDLGLNVPPNDAPFNDADWDFTNTWDYSTGLELRTPFTFLSPPGVVTGTAAIQAEDINSAAVSWVAPEENGGEAITRYRIEIKESGEEWENLLNSTHENEDLEVAFYNLRLGESYDIRVRAQTKYTVSEWAEISYDTPEPEVVEIDTCQELEDMSNQATHLDTFVLIDDVDCDGFEGFTPVYWEEGDFRGVFDGQGYSIKNLHISGEDDYVFGLFKYMNEALIEDIVFEDGSVIITGDGGSCGALAGDVDSAAIYNVAVLNYEIDCLYNSGGVVGDYEYDEEDRNITLSGLYASGTVNARDNNAGGLFGSFSVDDESIANLEQSYSDATVTAQYSAGGLIGDVEVENDDDDEDPDAVFTLADSYATGIVEAVGSAGGLIGFAESYNDGYDSLAHIRIESSYSASQVTASEYNAGGLIGYMDELYDDFTKLTVLNSFAVGPVDSPLNDYGLIGGDEWDEGDGEFVGEGNYFDVTTTGQEQRSYQDGVMNGYGVNLEGNEGSYFLGNNTNPPLDAWDFDDVWVVNEAALPTFGDAWYLNDGDDDGIRDQEEQNGPNGGDANNDNIDDDQQANVASWVNPVTEQYAVLEVDEGCAIQSVVIVSEAEVTNATDAGYDYPAGLMDFRVDCGEENAGITATIKQHYYGVSGTFTLRKYRPTSGFFAVSGATFATTTIDSKTVTTATYQVKDGSVLDLDDTENGSIEDPAGLGQSIVGAPNTGLRR